MSNLTSVTLTSGVPTAGTGTVSTIDNIPNLQLTTQIGNGTSTAAIKAASTSPVATDPALVVSISPNSVNANGSATSANSAPVVIASDQAAVTVKGGGTAGSPGTAVLAVQGVSSGTAVAISGPNANGSAVSASSAPVVIASDQATLAMSHDTSQILNGKSGVSLTPATAKVNISSAGTTTVIALSAGKQIRILAAYLVVGGANNVNWQSHTTTSNGDSTLNLAANSGIVLNYNPLGWFDTTSGEALDIVTSTSAQLSGRIVYVYH